MAFVMATGTTQGHREGMHRRAFGISALAVALSACHRGSDSSIKLGVAALRISLPVFVAASRRLFATHGVSVELQSYATAQPMIDDLLLGRLHAAGFAAYPIVVASARTAKVAPLFATQIVEDRAHRLSYAIARKGSGLSFPRGMAKKRIGILPTIAYQRWLGAILYKGGVPPADVTITPIAPPMQARALADGAVDVLFTNDPMATAILASGQAEIVDDGPPCATWLGEPFAFGGFVVGGAFAHDPRARSMVNAIDAAIDEVRADPVGAKRAMAAYLRPDERAWVDRYPEARFLRSNEVPHGAVETEIERERGLGILDGTAEVGTWPPAR